MPVGHHPRTHTPSLASCAPAPRDRQYRTPLPPSLFLPPSRIPNTRQRAPRKRVHLDSFFHPIIPTFLFFFKKVCCFSFLFFSFFSLVGRKERERERGGLDRHASFQHHVVFCWIVASWTSFQYSFSTSPHFSPLRFFALHSDLFFFRFS